DADMGFGLPSTGREFATPDGVPRPRSLAEYRDQMRAIVRQGLVDIMLMSTSTSEVLTLEDRLFESSAVTPAIRANDATDVHVMRGSRVFQQPARPFRTTSLDHAQCGHLDCDAGERIAGSDLGLYSVTFNNDVELDRETLEAYRLFRDEAERKGFRHFLEVFHPNAAGAVEPELLMDFINDAIARTLAGVASAGRPIFLKIPYPGAEKLEELVAYDPHLIVGILGGSSGTTRDAFQLLEDARRHGARAALFGRKINHSENQLAFVEFLRLIADGDLTAEEAVPAYHAVLGKLGIRPLRSLAEDQQVTETSLSYGGADKAPPLATTSRRIRSGDGGDQSAPQFAKMTSAERLAYHQSRLKKMFGE
ncbi:MAG: hypothetical protein KDA75_22410, partial [Planctomycetaceae bacterium]|nr:hypothetical protein [Planctomycetaceae bacterium]